jgi:hypothetical protein
MSKELLTFQDVACELHIAETKLNYILTRDGITAAERSGRGRGGGRMFRRSQLATIKKSLSATRQYTPRTPSWGGW